MADVNQIAEYLITNRLRQQVVDNIPEAIYPGSEAEAYQVQERLVSRLTGKYNSRVCGYKLACTNTMAMELLGVAGPFSGRLMSHSTHSDGVALPADDFVRRVVELEFAFVMDRDVPDTAEAFSAQTIEQYIGGFIPGIEVVDHCFRDFTRVGGNALIADNAIHGASILGTPVTDWQSMDLSQHLVRLMVNDKLFSQGSGNNVLGSPLNAMAWLANHLQARGSALKSGDLVTTGTACEVYNAKADDSITADFGELGSVLVSFT